MATETTSGVSELEMIAAVHGTATVCGAPEGLDALVFADTARLRGGVNVFIARDDSRAAAFVAALQFFAPILNCCACRPGTASPMTGSRQVRALPHDGLRHLPSLPPVSWAQPRWSSLPSMPWRNAARRDRCCRTPACRSGRAPASMWTCWSATSPPMDIRAPQPSWNRVISRSGAGLSMSIRPGRPSRYALIFR